MKLPERPTSCFEQMVLHLSMTDGHSGTLQIYGPDKKPIEGLTRVYRTGGKVAGKKIPKSNTNRELSGFFVDDLGPLSWDEAREAYENRKPKP